MDPSTVDPREYLNDNEEAHRVALDNRQGQMWTAMPAVVSAVNLAEMTLDAIPTIQGRFVTPDGTVNYVDMPPCLDCPICFPSGGGFIITYPIEVGDEILLVFANRCIDSWWQSGPQNTPPAAPVGQTPMEFRMHDLSDGFAIPGPRSKPNVASSISATDLQIRSLDGTAFLSITASDLFGFQNATVSLKKVLTDFQSAMNTFMTVLAAFSGGSAPVTQSMLQAPAAAAETSLGLVLTEIGELLK